MNTDSQTMMDSPILIKHPHEGENVLVLDDEDERDCAIDFHIQPWFMTLYTKVIQAKPSKHIVYKVKLIKNSTVLDLLLAFERYLSLLNSRLFQNDNYIPREKWLGDLVDGSTLTLVEDGAIKETQP